MRQLIEPENPAGLLCAQIPDNIVVFSTLELHPTLLRGVEDLGFERPTPIQAEAIPAGLEGPGIALVIAGIMALAFIGFSGIIQ